MTQRAQLRPGPGMVLAALRRKTGLTIRQTEQRAHVTRGFLGRVERGEVVPASTWFGYIAEVLSDELVAIAVSRAEADQSGRARSDLLLAGALKTAVDLAPSPRTIRRPTSVNEAIAHADD